MGFRRALQVNILAGILVLTPAVVSIYVFVQLILFFDRPLGRALTRLTGLHIPGVGFAALVLLVLLVGLFTRNLVGNHLVGLARKALVAVPLLGTLYAVLEQTLSLVMSGRGHGFRRVVLVEYPVPGSWALGLVAGEGGIAEEPPAGTSLTRVFLPTSPNPTTGFVLLVPPERLRPTRLTVEDALKMLVSGGIVGPEGQPESGGASSDPLSPETSSFTAETTADGDVATAKS